MKFHGVLAVIAALGAIGWVTSATADEIATEAGTEDVQALTELVQILKNQGVLDEAEYNHLTAKAAKRETKPSWTDRISLWGDFRSRYEGFFYTGRDANVPDRNRLRYRLRLNGKAKINSHAEILFRITSGRDDDRSTNTTLGNVINFDSDPIRITRAYVRISPFAEGRLPDESGTAWVEFGKVPNPYLWKVGKDFMLWDHDITFEGVSFLVEDDVVDDLNVFLRGGYYVVEERSTHADPNLLAAQLGGHYELTEDLTIGSRVSWYRFGDIYSEQISCGATGDFLDGDSCQGGSGGNIPDGLTGSAGGGSFNVIEGGLYLQARLIDDWPITLYGNISSNLSAESSDIFTNAGKDDLAWGVGGEIGDKKQYLKLGVGYWQIQANATFSGFVDSDLFDGKTNRRGFAFYASKEIMESTEVALTTFWDRPIETNLPAYAESVSKSHRVRVQADMKFKF